MSLQRILTLALLGMLAACGGSEAPQPPATSSRSALPESFHLAQAPAQALDVVALREGPAAGDEVVVRGKVQDLGASFATLTLVDRGLKSCDELHGDSCATPWDYCCEDPSTLAARSVQVEFREGDEPLAQSVEGFHGVERLSLVTVRGRFEPDEAGNLLIVADGIHVGS